MTDRNSTQAPLTALQRALVDAFSSRGPMTADQVRTALDATHPLKDSSVRTLLRRLEARGLLSHTVEGRVFVYRAETSSKRMAARSVKQLIDGFWAGSAERFLAGLVDEKVLSASELERLARKVKARK